MEQDQGLSYQISTKGRFLVTTFRGNLSKHDSDILALCQKEISESAADRIVLNWQELAKISLNGIPALFQFQKALRDAGKVLRHCCLTESLQKILQERAAIELSKVSKNLQEALSSFPAD